MSQTHSPAALSARWKRLPRAHHLTQACETAVIPTRNSQPARGIQVLLLLVRLSLAVDVTEDSGQVVEAVDPREKSTVEHLVGQLAGGIEPSVRYRKSGSFSESMASVMVGSEKCFVPNTNIRAWLHKTGDVGANLELEGVYVQPGTKAAGPIAWSLLLRFPPES